MGYTGKKPATSAQIDSSADIVDGVIQSQDIQTLDAAKLTGTVVDARISALTASKLTGTVATARLGTGTADSTKFLRGDGSWQVVSTPVLDSPVITGTLSVLSGGSVTHTISNWSDDLSWTITPTNCTVGSVNASGEFVITHTSGTPSYTILATTASLGLDDSALVTKNITLTLTAPTLSSPADVGTATNVVYTITSTDSNDDKLILNIGSSNFTYQSVSVGTASKVGNTVECVGFTTNNPAVTIQFTAEATYSVTATSAKIDGTFVTSAASSADSILINNFTGMVATGGDQSPSSGVIDGDYKYHTFTTTGSASFQVTTAGSEGIEYLVIAGGGGGGSFGGGGGAGGYRTATSYSLPAGTYSITVGGGGAAAGSYGANGTVGGDSSIAALIVSAGGGYGGGTQPVKAGGSGGSGGGGGYQSGAGGTSSSNGNAGGVGASSGTFSGGGGGSGAVGTTGSVSGSHGGSGTASSITGSSVTRAGGGGGFRQVASTGGTGGLGDGGGNGGWYSGSNGTATAGTANTGSGGGGSYMGPAAGGSGIVIIKYQFQN